METENKNMNSIHFDSILDIMEFDESQMHKHNVSGFRESRNQHLGHRSVPTAPYAKDCIEFALIGDNKLYQEYALPKIEELNRHINSKPDDYIQHIQQKKRKRVKTNFGNELDIHAVFQGRLDQAWDSTKIIEKDQEHRFITILADIGENWGADAKHSIWTMAVILKINDEIELAGKNVQIIVGDCARETIREKPLTTISCTIKKYNERLSVERLAAMTHLGFFRSFCFMGLYSSKYMCQEGLGWHESFDKEKMPIGIKEEIAEGHTRAIIIRRSLNLDDAVNSLKSAYSQLKEICLQ
jgi:hypothetical protein